MTDTRGVLLPDELDELRRRKEPQRRRARLQALALLIVGSLLVAVVVAYTI